MGVQDQLDAFAARLTVLNHANVMRRGMPLRLEDPRDLRDRLESMCAAAVAARRHRWSPRRPWVPWRWLSRSRARGWRNWT
jgi:hypothetical protein